MTNNIFFWNKRIAPVPALMMTWEVTTAFDGTLTETELQNRFDEEFRDAIDGAHVGNRVNFWPLVSFNASDGRRHRYLVAVADKPLASYRKNFDRCLPEQVALYAVADKILRGECGIFGIENAEDCAGDGNLWLVALWNKTLFMLVFIKGRLCHWSEEHGYGKIYDEACRNRIRRFKIFLETDELFANVGTMNPITFCEESMNVDGLFRLAVHDPFWRCLDLDKCKSLKLCEKRRMALYFVLLFSLCLGNFFVFGFSLEKMLLKNSERKFHDVEAVAPVELDLPPSDVLDLLAWAKGHGHLLSMQWSGKQEQSTSFRKSCDSLSFKLLGIAGDRVALVKTATGESKTLSLGDTLYSYRVKKIGRNNVVLRCGDKEIRYEVGAW